MRSMTGYGAGVSKTADVELEIQIRSVNARFLDMRFHLPREYMAFEADMKKRIAKIFSRGSVDVFIQRRPNVASRVVPIQFNKAQAKAWMASVEQLKKTLGLKDPVHLHDLLDLPHIFEVSERVQLDKQEESMLKKTFDAALKSCQKAREGEGQQLQKEIFSLLGELGRIVQALEPWREKAQERIGRRLADKMKETGVENADPARVAVETAVQLDKMDVREELVRLSEHVKACQGFIKNEDVHGKRLDFYAQELLREANTIGSKIQMAEMTELVVRAKTVIENFREQVQNVE